MGVRLLRGEFEAPWGYVGDGEGDPEEKQSQVTQTAISMWLGAVGDRWLVRSDRQD